MSYIVSIVRSAKAKSPLTQTDIENLRAKDKSLEYDSTTQTLSWIGHPSGEKVELYFERGHLESMTTPDEKTMDKLEEIAKSLGAALEGEDGARSRSFFSGFKVDPLLVALGVIFGIAFLGLGLVWLLKTLKVL